MPHCRLQYEYGTSTRRHSGYCTRTVLVLVGSLRAGLAAAALLGAGSNFYGVMHDAAARRRYSQQYSSYSYSTVPSGQVIRPCAAVLLQSCSARGRGTGGAPAAQALLRYEYCTRINSAGALLAIRLLSEVFPQYIRTPSVSFRTVK